MTKTQMKVVKNAPKVSVRLSVWRTSVSRNGTTIIPLRVTAGELGRLVEILLREGQRGFGVINGEYDFRLSSRRRDERGPVRGCLTLVRTGASRNQTVERKKGKAA